MFAFIGFSEANTFPCRLTPRISDALPTQPENHFIHPALAACACYAAPLRT